MLPIAPPREGSPSKSRSTAGLRRPDQRQASANRSLGVILMRSADSGEAARGFRDDAAHRSEMMSPGIPG